MPGTSREIRTVGRTDLRIPSIVFGAMARHDANERQRIDVLRMAIESGLTTIDVAPLYDFGEAERQLAGAMKGMPRDRIQIMTKVGLRWNADDHGEVLFEFTHSSGKRASVRKDSRPESILWEVDQSLERLSVDCLDLVQVHHPDVTTPVSETMEALLLLRSQGKLRHIGVSNYSNRQIAAAQSTLGDVPLCSVQSEYNLLRRGIETDLIPMCIEDEIGVLAYSPLAGGILANTRHPRRQGLIGPAIEELFDTVANDHGSTQAAVALAWVAAQPGITAAITGASNPAQVLELAAALELKLTDSEIDTISRAFEGVSLVYSWESRGGLIRRITRKVRNLARRLSKPPNQL